MDKYSYFGNSKKRKMLMIVDHNLLFFDDISISSKNKYSRKIDLKHAKIYKHDLNLIIETSLRSFVLHGTESEYERFIQLHYLSLS